MYLNIETYIFFSTREPYLLQNPSHLNITANTCAYYSECCIWLFFHAILSANQIARIKKMIKIDECKHG